MTQKAQPTLYDNLEDWHRVGRWGEVQKVRDVCILMADSHCCMAETNITLYSNCPPIIKNKITFNNKKKMRSLFLLGPFLSLDLSLDATDKPHKICFNKE